MVSSNIIAFPYSNLSHCVHDEYISGKDACLDVLLSDEEATFFTSTMASNALNDDVSIINALELDSPLEDSMDDLECSFESMDTFKANSVTFMNCPITPQFEPSWFEQSVETSSCTGKFSNNVSLANFPSSTNFVRQSQMAPRKDSLNQSSMMTDQKDMRFRKKLPYDGLCDRRMIPNSSINQDDVLFGRGKKSNNHPGNMYFRELVSRMASHYKDCTRKQNTALSHSIVDAIQKKGGKFLSPVSNDSNFWVEMRGVALRKKTSQAMRDSSTYQV